MKRRSLLGGIGAFAAGLVVSGKHRDALADDDEQLPWMGRAAKKMPRWRANVAGPVLLSRDATAVTVANSTTETDLLSYAIPAGMLGSDHAVRLRLVGDYHNNSGSDKTFTFRIKLGSTTIASQANMLTTSATVKGFHFEFELNQIAVNSQLGAGTMFDWSNLAVHLQGTAAEDEDTELTFAVTVQISGAHASADCHKYFAQLELL